jgi:predicted nuclease of predicted toxin-antitoxin system
VIRFLIDADLPRSVFAALRDRGLFADGVRDLGLGTATDDIVIQFAKTHAYALISADKGLRMFRASLSAPITG